MNDQYFRPRFCTIRLYWAGDNLVNFLLEGFFFESYHRYIIIFSLCNFCIKIVVFHIWCRYYIRYYSLQYENRALFFVLVLQSTLWLIQYSSVINIADILLSLCYSTLQRKYSIKYHHIQTFYISDMYIYISSSVII